MDSPSPVTLVQHCSSEFSDSGEPSVFKQSVYVYSSQNQSFVANASPDQNFVLRILTLEWDKPVVASLAQ